MNKNLIPLILTAIIFSGCLSKYAYWDVAKFNIKPGALENKEEVKIIYTSRGPDYNQDQEYYIHLVVVSQKTGDTVNILTTAYDDLKQGDENKIFNYFSPEDPVFKLSQMEVEKIMEIDKIDNLNKIKIKKITKVARDREFDDIADNKFPTVLGVIGTLELNKVE